MSSTLITDNTTCHGTWPVEYLQHKERGSIDSSGILLCTDHYECITAQNSYRAFSLEELRLADYKEGHGGERTRIDSQRPAWCSATPMCSMPLGKEKRARDLLSLLRGPGIEIFVGSSAIPSDSLETSAGSPDTLSGSSETPSDSPAASYHKSETWTLPVALISHFSPILRAACTRDFKERQERLIKLPEDNPDAFALFVEWLYYGDYSISPALSLTKTPHSINIDLQCWVLGDKLLCTDFKNYAMRRIYQRYTRVVFGLGVMTTYEVDYVCANTAAGSNLMNFFCAFVGEHFAVERRLEGTVEMWDQLILEHADLRRFLLERFRMGIVGERGVKAEEEYMDVELDEADALPSDVAKLNVEAGD